MSPVMRPAGVRQSDVADESAVKSWLDALASGTSDAPAFLRAVQDRFGTNPEATWEVLSQLDQYYRRGRIETETFKTIKTALAEAVLGRGDVPVARDIVVPNAARALPASFHAEPAISHSEPAISHAEPAISHAEQTDSHQRSEEQQSLDAAVEAEPGRVLRRRYRLEVVVGQSGMGTVFQALDEFRLETPGSQRLAVKVLHSAVVKRAELLAALRREFQSLQLLSHPNIVRVFEFDRDGSLVFFTMELLAGAPLSRVLQVRKLNPLERTQALAVIHDIGAAVAYAHSRGVVHGNLNLQNIFITGTGELRVLGFGGAHKALQTSMASDHEMMLPLAASAYASCQVLEGERADARDDVFALACIIYLLLSGDHPFSKRTAIEARDARVNLRRPAGLGGRQWQALHAALRWERERRPADLRQWLAQLDLSGAAKRLAPLSDLLESPARKESRSTRLVTGIAAGVALLLAGAYWILNHRNTLPHIDSTTPAHAPAASVRPSPEPASLAAPVVAPSAPPPTASPPPAASTLRAAPPPPAASAPVAVSPAPTASTPRAAAPLPAASAPVAASPPHTASTPRAASTPPATSPRSAAPVAATAASPGGASKVELATDTVEVEAGEPAALVLVHRKGNLRGETSFTWWTESGTAKPGADFSAVVPQLAHIGDGKSGVSLSIPLSNVPHTLSKSFYVVIDHSDGGAALGARTLTMVTLLPRD